MQQKQAVLVTGGAGYIGAHIGYLLAQQGYQVVVLDNFSQNQVFTPLWAEVVCGDYADTKLLHKIFTHYNVVAVMHCAAFTVVSISVQKPLEYYHNNVAKTITLLKSMHKHGIQKCIFSSSSAVYGIPQTLSLSEDHPLVPITPYGVSKMMVEQLLRDCAKAHDLQFVVLRYFNAAGTIPGSHLFEWHIPETHCIPLLLQSLAVGSPFYIFGTDYPTQDGTCIRDYVHVHDIADAHIKALQHLQKERPSEIFNIGTGAGWSVQQLVTAAQNITQRQCEIIKTKRRDGDFPVLVANSQKAMEILGWQPRYSVLDYCIETAWQSYRVKTQGKKKAPVV